MQHRCGDCFWFRRTQVELWAAPVAVGTCTFGPAPQVIDTHRSCSANDGRGCHVFVPAAPQELSRR